LLELLLNNYALSQVIHSLGTSISKVIIDEAHCIQQWGDHFHLSYGQVHYLHTLVPLKAPFMVASAMMAPSVYEHITRSLGFNLACTYEVNLGNYRKNIYQEVHIMSGNTHDFKSDFDFIVDEAK